MSAAHTPGEWSLGGRYGLVGVEVVAGSVPLCVVNRVLSNRLDGLNKIRSASAGRGEPAHAAEREATGLEQGLAEAIANGNLIAAAPNQNDALAAIVQHCNPRPGEYRIPTDALLDAARAALTKAEGGAT